MSEFPRFEIPLEPFAEKGLVILSGGQDSATCLFLAQKCFETLHTITFDYGQRHRVELECAAALAQKVGAKHTVIPVDSLAALGSNALTDTSIQVSATGGMNGLPSTFVPGRNALFLTLAAAYAAPRGISDLVIGTCETDFSGYPDCREKFIASMEQSLSLAMDVSFTIHRPLMFLNKAQTFLLAHRLHALKDVVEGTHTCYEGNHSDLNAWGYGCAKCPACELRRKGYEEFLKYGQG